MKLPSGIELPREKVEELCEAVIREKFYNECTFHEAFEPTDEGLAAGELDGIPVLESDDIQFIQETLRKPVFQCVEALTQRLVSFFTDYVKKLDW